MDEYLIEHFNENGFVVAENLLPSAEINHYRKVLEEAIKYRKRFDNRELSEKSEYEQSLIQCQNLWEDFPEIRKLAFDQRIASTAAKLLGVDRLRIWHDQALVKESGGRETDIHQDQAYWPIKETNTITAWIPMIPISEGNGQMGFFSGSHKIKEVKFVNIFKGKVAQQELERLPQVVGKKPKYIKVKAGDVSFHHGLTFHTAKPNKTKKDRTVFTVIFFSDGSTRRDDQFHFSVDRAGIKVGEIIDSDVTPLAFPINKPPNRPKEPISEEFVFPKALGLLPED